MCEQVTFILAHFLDASYTSLLGSEYDNWVDLNRHSMKPR